MYKVALIHTVKSVVNTFEDRIKDAIGDIKVDNILDEYIASDTAERGEISIENMNRLFSFVKCAEMTSADAVVVTCSTLSPAIEKIKPFVKVPLITIDEAMIRKAAELGIKITILATADSTIGPTKSKLLSEIQKLHKNIELSIIVCHDAYDAMKDGNMEKHDEVLKIKALEIKQQNVIILAQASMAHLEGEIGKICGCNVLSSPKMCIAQLKEILEGTDNKR